MKPRILVAGFGNDLCQDDGFGIVGARRFAADSPPHVRVVEIGIGGIGLVQELMDGYDTLIILDAVDRGGEPGRVYMLEVEVPQQSADSRRHFFADMHLTVPSAALTLAQALDVLPRQVYILGCQPKEHDLGMGLSQPVERAVNEALERLTGLIAGLQRDLVGI